MKSLGKTFRGIHLERDFNAGCIHNVKLHRFQNTCGTIRKTLLRTVQNGILLKLTYINCDSIISVYDIEC
jgi:hypothetical protein